MSSSIIEAKFQVLDRATKQLSRANHRGIKLSSQQLRDIVQLERRQARSGSKGNVVSVHGGVEASEQAIPEVNFQIPSPPANPENSLIDKEYDKDLCDEASNNPSNLQAKVMIGTAARRTHEIRNSSMEEIRTSLARDKAISQLDDPVVIEGIHAKSNSETARDQHLDDPITGALQEVFVNKPSAPPGRPSRKEKCGVARCRSASRSKSTTNLSSRDWFTLRLQPRPPSPKLPKQQLQQADSAPAGTHREYHEHDAERYSSKRRDHSNESEECAIDLPSFYFLELRLDHPEPLTTWRFQAVFTDLTAEHISPVTFDDLTVDSDNCLMFTVEDQNNATCRFFNPLAHFAGFRRPRDLYNHTLHIRVVSTYPLQRTVIDSRVHYTLSSSISEPDEVPQQQSEELAMANVWGNPECSPSIQQNSQHSAPPLLSSQSPTRRRRAATSPGREAPRRAPKSAELDDNLWTPWDSQEGQQARNLHPGLSVMIERKSPPKLSPPSRERSLSPTFHDELIGQALPTTERKKIQLRQLRQDVRRRMQAASLGGSR